MALSCEGCVFSPKPIDGTPCTMNPENVLRAVRVGIFCSGQRAGMKASEHISNDNIRGGDREWATVDDRGARPDDLVRIKAPSSCVRVAQLFVDGLDIDEGGVTQSPQASPQEQILEEQSIYNHWAMMRSGYPRMYPGNITPEALSRQAAFFLEHFFNPDDPTQNPEPVTYLTDNVSTTQQSCGGSFKAAQAEFERKHKDFCCEFIEAELGLVVVRIRRLEEPSSAA